MKRIDFISRCKGVLADVLNRKSARIMRQIDQAIDSAKDKAQDCADSAEEIMNSFGKYADAEQTNALQGRINMYIDKMKEGKEWEETATFLAAAKVKLQEEVEVEEEKEEKKK